GMLQLQVPTQLAREWHADIEAIPKSAARLRGVAKHAEIAQLGFIADDQTDAGDDAFAIDVVDQIPVLMPVGDFGGGLLVRMKVVGMKVVDIEPALPRQQAFQADTGMFAQSCAQMIAADT